MQKKIKHPCKFCCGAGRIEYNNINRECPECYGRGYHLEWEPYEWHILDNLLTIGKIEISFYDKNLNKGTYQEQEYQENYMCLETGIGTGTNYEMQNLFLTEKEAQTECDKRNALLKSR